MSRLNQERPRNLQLGSIVFSPQRPLEALESVVSQLNLGLIPVLELNVRRLEQAFKSPASVQLLAAGDRILHETDIIEIAGKTGAVTLTSVPTISDGYAGERRLLVGTSDANTVKLQAEASLTGSNLKLPADRTLGKGDTLDLVFSETTGYWHEVCFTNNP